jgi:mono/diheme cytochrome c family protein
MKMNALIFVIGFILAFAGGYLIFGGNGGDTPPQPVQETTTETEEDATDEEEADEGDEVDESDDTEEAEDQEGEQTTSVDIQPMTNCLSCHAVDSLGVAGGNAGPDLSNAYTETEGKHGKDLDSFLQEPTSAVMATVIEDDPITDEEREAIVDILRQASEAVE